MFVFLFGLVIDCPLVYIPVLYSELLEHTVLYFSCQTIYESPGGGLLVHPFLLIKGKPWYSVTLYYLASHSLSQS